MKAAAERLSSRYPIRVVAVRSNDGPDEADVFMVWTGRVTVNGQEEWRGSTYYVPVRRRRRAGLLGGRVGPWREVQGVAAAAAEVARRVPDEPD